MQNSSPVPGLHILSDIIALFIVVSVVTYLIIRIPANPAVSQNKVKRGHGVDTKAQNCREVLSF